LAIAHPGKPDRSSAVIQALNGIGLQPGMVKGLDRGDTPFQHVAYLPLARWGIRLEDLACHPFVHSMLLFHHVTPFVSAVRISFSYDRGWLALAVS
jgi:hypothetical protein